MLTYKTEVIVALGLCGPQPVEFIAEWLGLSISQVRTILNKHKYELFVIRGTIKPHRGRRKQLWALRTESF